MELLPYIGLIFLGLFFIFVDVVFIPGAIMATIGTIVVLGTLYRSLQVFGTVTATVLACSTLALVALCAWMIIRFRLWHFVAHRGAEEDSGGFLSHDGSMRTLVGKNGVSSTALRPAGKVRIDGRFYDAVSDGAFIERGTEVSVTGISGAQIKVIPK